MDNVQLPPRDTSLSIGFYHIEMAFQNISDAIRYAKDKNNRVVLNSIKDYPRKLEWFKKDFMRSEIAVDGEREGMRQQLNRDQEIIAEIIEMSIRIPDNQLEAWLEVGRLLCNGEVINIVDEPKES